MERGGVGDLDQVNDPFEAQVEDIWRAATLPNHSFYQVFCGERRITDP